MSRRGHAALRIVSLAGALLLLPAWLPVRVQLTQLSGISGYVLDPDGAPVSGGRVVLQAMGRSASALIERTGRFHIDSPSVGVQELHVAVPQRAPYRVNVDVPPSQTLRLPVIRLSTATYFSVRLVTAAGEALASPAISRQSLDFAGLPIRTPIELRPADFVDWHPVPTGSPWPCCACRRASVVP